jgi:hypothetical protein
MKLSYIKCLLRFIYYWFKYPTGYHISGHEFVEQDGGILKCRDCGYISK